MEDWFNNAVSMFNGQEVKNNLSPVLNGDEDTIDTYFMALAEQEKYQEILEASAEAIWRKPSDAQARAWHGYALMNLYQYEKAIETFKEALAFNPDYMPAMGNLAEAYLNNSQYDEAIAEINKFLMKYPFCIDALTTLGLSYVGQNKFGFAEKIFRRALKIKPNDMDIAIYLVRCLNEQGETKLDDDDDNFEAEVLKLMSIWRLENEIIKGF